jgi:hypothetical protein
LSTAFFKEHNNSLLELYSAINDTMAQPNVKKPVAQKPAARIPSKSPSISAFVSKKTDNTAPSKNGEA